MLNFDQIMLELTATKDIFGQRFQMFVTYMMLATGNFFLISWACLGIGIFVLLIVVSSIIVFSYRAKDKCHFFSCPTNFCTFILGFSNLIFSIFCIVFLAINYITKGLCDYSYQVVVDPSISVQIQEYFSDDIKGFLNAECLKEAGASLTQYAQISDPGFVEDLDEIGVFLDGFTYYDNFLTTVSADRFDNGIEDVINDWTEYKEGLKDNFYNFPDALAALNAQTLACNEYWVVNSKQCRSEDPKTCKDVVSNNSFDGSRGCLDDGDATAEQFRKIRSSFESQNQLVSEMIGKLGNISGNSAHFEVGVTSTSKCARA